MSGPTPLAISPRPDSLRRMASLLRARTGSATHSLTLDLADRFGSAVALSADGNTLYVGAPRDDTGDTDRGAVYVFAKSGSSWSQSAKIASGSFGLTLSDEDRFGSSIGLASDGATLFVGAERDDTGGTEHRLHAGIGDRRM